MAWATVVLHGDLNDFPLSHRRGGVAHRRGDGARVEVWPAAEAAEWGLVPVLPAAPEDLADPRFVVDAHLGRLATYLRMLGFDTWYRNDADDDQLAAVAAAEGRILLTRDRGLLKRSVVRRGAYLRSDQPVEQLVEVALRFGPVDRWRPFGRCLRCNTLLVSVSREEVLHRLQPLTRIYYDDFRRCPGCGAIYWKGSHHARMERPGDRGRAMRAGPAPVPPRRPPAPGAGSGCRSHSGRPRPRRAARPAPPRTNLRRRRSPGSRFGPAPRGAGPPPARRGGGR